MSKLQTFLALLFLFTICNHSTAQTDPQTALAEAHGISDWHTVEAIEFTFFVNRKPAVARHWSWLPKTGKITRTVAEETIAINANAVETDLETEVHRQFINDSFWLLMPFSMAWSNPTVSDHGATELKLDGVEKSVQKITALWPSDEGYTPGDAYDLFIGDNSVILGWTFRKANAPDGRFFEWKNPMQLGPIRVYKDYYKDGGDKPLIQFKDLRIQLTGDAQWQTPAAIR
ncbi:MAG: hypothetical protein ACSHYA_04865 [Opitutaceae bacterium]